MVENSGTDYAGHYNNASEKMSSVAMFDKADELIPLSASKALNNIISSLLFFIFLID